MWELKDTTNPCERVIFLLKTFNSQEYFKTEEIYKKLKSADVENLLLFEMTLGFGLTNIIFMYLEDIEFVQDIKEFETIIKIICSIPGINIRNCISKIVFCNLWKMRFEKEKIKETEKILSEVLKEINTMYLHYLRIYKIYFEETINQKEENIFSYADFLYGMKQRVKEEQEEYWNGCMIDDFSDIAFRSLYEKLGMIKVEEAYRDVKICDELQYELFKYENNVHRIIINSDDPDFYDLRKMLEYTDNSSKILGYVDDRKIIRSHKEERDQEYLYRNNFTGIREELEKILIKKKKANAKKAKITKKTDINAKYAFLHKIIVYHLLNDLSKDGRIPVIF